MEVSKKDKIAYSLPEVASLTGLSLSYLYRLSSEGKLPISKIGSRALILRTELEEFLKNKIRSNINTRKV